MHHDVAVFVYSDLNEGLRGAIRERFPNTSFNDPSDAARSAKVFREASLVMGNPPKDWFREAHNIAFWQLDSAGFDQYRTVTTKAIIANMGDFFSVKCAETIVAGILAFYRSLPPLVKLQQKKKWVGKPLRYQMDMLSGKRTVLLGAGTIARAIAKMLNGFDCKVSFMARTNPLATIRSVEQLLDQLPETDILINTLPGSAGKAVTKDFFDALPTTALYASVGRGNTTDEDALIAALESGSLSGAVLDVTQKEPLPVSSPLWGMENVILTQHTGGGHRLEDEGKVNLFLENASLFLNGQPVRNRVDLSMGY